MTVVCGALALAGEIGFGRHQGSLRKLLIVQTAKRDDDSGQQYYGAEH